MLGVTFSSKEFGSYKKKCFNIYVMETKPRHYSATLEFKILPPFQNDCGITTAQSSSRWSRFPL